MARIWVEVIKETKDRRIYLPSLEPLPFTRLKIYACAWACFNCLVTLWLNYLILLILCSDLTRRNWNIAKSLGKSKITGWNGTEGVPSCKKTGLKSQTIFEATGFEPIQQNQIIVGSQVYGSLEGRASEAVRYYANQVAILYNFVCWLRQNGCCCGINLVTQTGCRWCSWAQSNKDFSRASAHLPEGFSAHPGDAVAYQCLRLVRQYTDLQERSRLIAKRIKICSILKPRDNKLNSCSLILVLSPNVHPYYPTVWNLKGIAALCQ